MIFSNTYLRHTDISFLGNSTSSSVLAKSKTAQLNVIQNLNGEIVY